MKRSVIYAAARRAALLALAALMTFLFCACGDTGTGGGTTAGGEAASTAPETEEALPKLDFGQTEVRFLVWSDAEHPEFEVKENELDGDIITDSIYTRNIKTEEQLGVKLTFIGEPGNSSNASAFSNKVGNSLQAGEAEYEIVASYSMTTGLMASNGYLQDISDTEYINFENPWWPSAIIEECVINNKLYFVSGDISTNTLHMMYVTFFNKDSVGADNVNGLYDLVENGGWTVDKLIELASDRYVDNGTTPGVADDGDTYGFCSYSVHTEAWFTGSGIKTVEHNADGGLIISPTFGSEKAQALLEKICNLYHNDDDFRFTGTNTAAGKSQQNIFAEGRAVFMFDRARLAMNKLRTYDDLKYGVLPLPKYNAEQESYITLMANPFTLYGIPLNVREDATDIASAVIEYMGGYAYENTTPAIYELSMKVKFADSGRDGMMYDKVREGISIDLGRLYNKALDSHPATLTTLVTNNQTGWLTTYSRIQQAFQKKLDGISAGAAAN